MGLFSKKTFVCENCGKEYEARIAIGGHICNECSSRIYDKKQKVKGYVDYAMKANLNSSYKEAQLDEIIAHRQQILEKYRMTHGISREELQVVSDNYKKLSDEQAADVLVRIANSTVNSTIGAAYTGNFFVPTNFDEIIVAAEDVFAVGYTSDIRLSADSQEVILCAVFTNDPYVPVFPMVYLGKLGFFEVFKSKKGRQGVSALFESMCPNLTYPVQDIKELKKQIKSEGAVRGKLDVKYVLDRISDVGYSSGLFDTKALFSKLLLSSSVMINQYGYLEEDEVNRILKMDKMFNRNYWNKQLEKLSKM